MRKILNQRLTVSNLGEFGLIERFRRAIKTDPSVIHGSGDDCAVIKFTKNEYLLFTCDMVVEGVDFLSKDDPKLIGRKALAISLSDIAACAGRPRYCLISMGIPKDTPIKRVDKIFDGILKLARKYKVNLCGGDLSLSPRLTIDVSMLGVVEKRCLVLRSQAKKDDIIFVSGSLGGSIHKKHLRFIPRVKEARFLAKNFKPNAMIDISDGLAQDLGHILKASRVGATIYEDLIPLSKDSTGIEDALYSGEDFELLFTLSSIKAKKLIKKNLGYFHPIGEITDKKYGLRLINRHGREKNIRDKGFTHF